MGGKLLLMKEFLGFFFGFLSKLKILFWSDIIREMDKRQLV